VTCSRALAVDGADGASRAESVSILCLKGLMLPRVFSRLKDPAFFFGVAGPPGGGDSRSLPCDLETTA
jgi:hypothetical protein